MSFASILKTFLLREIVPDAVAGTSAPTAKIARTAKKPWFQRQPECEHHHLEFDDLNDVYCRDCGRDFTD